jgi:Fe-S cluster assembly ATP-binding protein
MDMLKRPLNVGFSGGEKKRAEILQMKLLEPKLCVLDETDSGLDIDACDRCRRRQRAAFARSRGHRHHPLPAPARLHRAGHVHVMSKGKIVKTGDKELALELEAKGYADIINQAA